MASTTRVGPEAVASVSISSPGSDEAKSIVIQTDGKLVIAGTCDGDSYCAARLLPNGSYDVDFGNTGLAGRFVQGFAATTLALSAAVQAPDGSIVLAGTSTASARHGLLLKVDPSGSQVDVFQVNHPAVLDGHYQLHAIAVQTDEKIVVAGTATNGSFDFVVTRILADLSEYDSSGDWPAAPMRSRWIAMAAQFLPAQRPAIPDRTKISTSSSTD